MITDAPVEFEVLIKGHRENGQVWIDFQDKREKWRFIQTHLPDLAKVILNGAEFFEFKPPILIVDYEWLVSLKGVSVFQS